MTDTESDNVIEVQATGDDAGRAGPLILPVSMAQQRLWLLEQLEPGRVTYHVPLVCRLRGKLDPYALEQAINEIVARHEVLRTTFDLIDGAAMQVIAPVLQVAMPVIDLAHLSAGDREAKARELIDAEVHRAFDLRRGPLLRPTLVRIDDDDHLFAIVLHHIVCDGWSMDVMMAELSLLYRARLNGRPSLLPELPIQYADFAQWQREQLQGEALDKLTRYWKERLRDVPALELATDHQRPGVQTGEGDTESIIIPPAIRDAIGRLARSLQASTFMVLLAAFKALLARYTGQTEIAIGTPIANRSRTELDPLIGFFANMLVLRTDMAGDPTFIEIVRRVRGTALDAYEHQELPFEKLVEELRPRRDRARHPLFQVAFLFADGPLQSPDLPGIVAEPIPVKLRIAKFDLMLAVFDRGDGLHCFLEYSTDLFEAASMRAMLGHLRVLLEAIAADPQVSLARLPLISDDERQTLLHRFNDTRRPYPRDQTIHALFDAQASATPNATAVIDGKRTLTYRELADRAARISTALTQRGVLPGDRVAICMNRSADLIACLLGILRCGAAYVPLDPDYPVERLRFMLDDIQSPPTQSPPTQSPPTQSRPAPVGGSPRATIVLHDGALPRALVEATKEVPSISFIDATKLESEASSAINASSPLSQVTAADLAYLIFTSGSTGVPKAVAVPHRGVVRLVKGADYIPFNADQRFLLLAPVSFDASTLELWGPLLNGGVCVVFPHRVPQLDLLEATIRDQRITCLWLTAALFNTVIDQRPAALVPIRHLLIGGEALSPAHVRRALAALPTTQIINGYGPTESTTFACTHPIPRDLPASAASIPIGRPISNTRVHILDDHRRLAPLGVPGELYIGGDGLARGYWNRPQFTDDRFIADPFSGEQGARLYRTGDRCRWRNDGTIEFLGRLDDQLKVRGFRIEPGEIEAALCKHPGVKQCVVIGESGTQRLIAYIVPSGAPPAADELSRHLKQLLPAYMVPAAFVMIEAIPLTPIGKVNRAALPAPSFATAHDDADAQPHDDLERELAALWSRTLGVERVGIHDNFFDLGGHSLAAVGLFDQIARRFGKTLPLATLFDHPTIAQLAPLLREDREAPLPPLIEPLKATGTRPPFFCVHGIGGDVLFLEPLARCMPDDQPFHGIRAMGTDEREEPDADIAAMARRYVAAIRQVQPRGPYAIGGFSSGGTIAFEMAQQLVLAGESIAMLAVFDHAPFNLGGGLPRWHPVSLARWCRNLPYYVMDDIIRPARPARAMSRLVGKLRVWRRRSMQRVGLAAPAKTSLDFQAMFGVTTLSDHRKRFLQVSYDALRHYQPRPYAGRVTVFRARTRPLFHMDLPEDHWRLIAGDVKSHVIPGAHEGIFRHPHVRELAEHLCAALSGSLPEQDLDIHL